MRWSPDVYRRRESERGRPFAELIARIDADRPLAVVDLGCGPGNQTALLARRWPDSDVLGIDSSPEMIDAARTVAGPELPNLRFAVGDLATWRPGPETDVVVSNAALHWVPEHPALIRRWLAELPDTGVLAFQVPGNFAAPSHRLMRELAESPRWAARLDPRVLTIHDTVRDPASYAALILDAGWRPDVWETTYLHLLGGPDPVLDWVRGTALRPVLAALEPFERSEFEAAYAERLRVAYPRRAEGTVFEFRRIFAVAHRDPARG